MTEEEIMKLPLTKRHQHMRCVVGCAVVDDLIKSVPQTLADTQLGRVALSLRPMVDDLTMSLRYPSMSDEAWKRIRGVFSSIAHSVAHDPSWPAPEQESMWATKVFLADYLWLDARILCPIWFASTPRVRTGVGLVWRMLEGMTETLEGKYGPDQGPAVDATEVWLNASKTMGRKL